MRRTVEAELQSERAELETVAAELRDREQAVATREQHARPSYRARFAAAGGGLVFVADVLVRGLA